jgi:23S rRNA (cytosine1962-C5)-methyltransferase
VLPCLIFEDEHLLVVNKPAGLNTHSPGPYAGEGIYDWLRHREPHWATLSIIHRLDKETSGVLVFSKTPVANRSLTEQFTRRAVTKHYVFLTHGHVPRKHFTMKSALVRVGDKYISRPLHAGAEWAETKFIVLPPAAPGMISAVPGARNLQGTPAKLTVVKAIPVTGRTHQIRVHAAEAGIPVLGDSLYGGAPGARVFLHAAELRFQHPVSGKVLLFSTPPDFDADSRRQLRHALLDSQDSSVYRLIHGASDGLSDLYVDRLGEYLLAQSQRPLINEQKSEVERLMNTVPARGLYHKTLARDVGRTVPAVRSPRLLQGQLAPERFVVVENGLKFELSFEEGYSVGLFLDQRDNRRRLLTGHIAAGFPLAEGTHKLSHLRVLNAFSYTCGFSVCAAKAGCQTTSLDLSPKYIEWGKRNFLLNGLDAAEHDFIHGDVFEWFRRVAKKGRSFDVILLDPPTFSQSKSSGTFRAEKDYRKLMSLTLPLLKRAGVLFASTNAARWEPDNFRRTIEEAVVSSGRTIRRSHYVPQPPDFPITRAEPAYLKTLWLAMGG